MKANPKWLLMCSLIILGLVLVNIIVFNGSSSSSSGDGNLDVHTFDIDMARKDQNYPVCQLLEKFHDQIVSEESMLGSDGSNLKVNQYQKLFEENKLHCGYVRVGGGVFEKKHVVPWSNCIEEIIPAKNRLVTYLEEVCANQELANRQLGASRSNESISKLRSAKGLDIKASLAEVPVHRGIVYTGKSCHIKDIYQSIYAVRKIIRSTIDIEVWVNLRDMDTCKQILEKAFHVDDASQGYVRCQELPSGIKGFTSKFYALLLSSFTDALFIDSDNVPVRDVNAIFDSEGYRSTGIVLWPDLWGDRCRYARPLPPHGETAFETFVLYAANFPSVHWRKDRSHAQEAEAGQVAINLSRHRGLLLLGKRLIEDRQFFHNIFYGDKDIFRMVPLMLNKAFHYVSLIPSMSTLGNFDRDCLVHYFDQDQEPRDLPFFFHQFKNRNANAFTKFWRLPPDMPQDVSVCMNFTMPTSLMVKDLDSKAGYDYQDAHLPVLKLEIKSGAMEQRLSTFGHSLIEGVDASWTSEFERKTQWNIFRDDLEDKTSLILSIVDQYIWRILMILLSIVGVFMFYLNRIYIINGWTTMNQFWKQGLP